jgi:hypothetical protein
MTKFEMCILIYYVNKDNEARGDKTVKTIYDVRGSFTF